MTDERGSAGTGAARVEKLMSADRCELARSWADLGATLGVGAAADPLVLPCGTGRVRLEIEPQPPARLGGLLELPRSRVSLHFEGVGDADRAGFLAAFDRAFQRGGG